jgi:hypothetical protein
MGHFDVVKFIQNFNTYYPIIMIFIRFFHVFFYF